MKKLLKTIFRPAVRSYMRRMRENFLPEIETLRFLRDRVGGNDRNPLEDYETVPTYWSKKWRDYLRQHESCLAEMKRKLETGLDEESISLVEYQLWLCGSILPDTDNFPDILYRKNFIWRPEDLFEKTAFERIGFRLPPQYDVLKNYDVSPYSVFTEFGLKKFSFPVADYLAGKDIIDGGAWIGDSSLVFASTPARRVFAFEPEKASFDSLVSNTGANEKVEPFKLGISDVNSKATLKCYGGNNQASGLIGMDVSSRIPWVNYSEEDVSTISLDSFASEHDVIPGLIKLDIEGNETRAILGAREIIKKYKPLIICALYHNPTDFFGIKPFLEDLVPDYSFMMRRLDFVHPCTDVYLMAAPRYPKEIGL